MKSYKLKVNIPCLDLCKGDEFKFSKRGYVFQFPDGDWIGLPADIVEDSPRYFKEINAELEAFRSDLRDYIFDIDTHVKKKNLVSELDALLEFVSDWKK